MIAGTVVADAPARPEEPARAERFPWAALLALATTGFVTIMTETMPAGLLGPIGRGLGVGNAAAGQLVTSYAVGSLVAAIPLVSLTLGWRRRGLLLLTVAGLGLFNAVTALSGDYALTMVARFGAGVVAGVGWGVIAGYARQIAPPGMQGRALAVALAGTPVALSVGTPAGTALGDWLGWRLTFGAMTAATVALACWVRFGVPDAPGRRPAAGASARALARVPELRLVLVALFAWMTAHNLLYTYVAPLAGRAGLGRHVDGVLFVFGVAALVSIVVAGGVVDRFLRPAVIAALLLFGIAVVALFGFGRVPATVWVASLVWGLSFGGASPLLNTAAAEAAGDGADLALAFVTTVWNGAIALGGLLGGALVASIGAASLAPAALVAVAVAFGLVWSPPGRRAFPDGRARRGAVGKAAHARPAPGAGGTARAGPGRRDRWNDRPRNSAGNSAPFS